MSSSAVHYLPFNASSSKPRPPISSRPPIVVDGVQYDFAVCHPTDGVRILNPNDGKVIPFTGEPKVEVEYPVLATFTAGSCSQYFRAVVLHTNANRDFALYTRAPEVLAFRR